MNEILGTLFIMAIGFVAVVVHFDKRIDKIFIELKQLKKEVSKL